MARPTILTQITNLRSAKRPGLALLIDPDLSGDVHLAHVIGMATAAKADLLLVGGSVIVSGDLGTLIRRIKAITDIPVVIFPGAGREVDGAADALLLLSLLSGRNPDYLIGQHVLAAQALKRSGLELIPTAYLLIDGGAPTTASYISGTQPLPANKPGLAATTALAGEQLGMRLIYADAGSGAQNPISPAVIKAIRQETTLPLIIGGGIRTPERAAAAWGAGADMVVVGNAAERDPDILLDIATARDEVGVRG